MKLIDSIRDSSWSKCKLLDSDNKSGSVAKIGMEMSQKEFHLLGHLGRILLSIEK